MRLTGYNLYQDYCVCFLAWHPMQQPVLLQVLDVGVTVTPTYLELKEVSLFLLQPNTVPTSAALGLYVSGPSFIHQLSLHCATH